MNLKALLKNKVVKNGLWLYALQAFNTLLPLITLPYITRVLGVEKYGTFSIALNIVAYLQVVIEYGYAYSATRKVAMNQKDELNLNKLFSLIITSRILLYFVSIVIALTYMVCTRKTISFNSPMLILSIGLIGYCLQENWIFQGKQEMKFISISTVLARTLTTLLIFLFVKSPKDIIIYCILYSLSPLISNTIGTIIAINKYKLKFKLYPLSDQINELASGYNVFLTQISAKVFGAIGVTFLGIFSTDYNVGIFSAINKIPYFILLIWNPIAQIIYPITSQKITDSFIAGKKYVNKIRKYILLLFSIGCIIVAIMAKPVVSFVFGSEYVNYYYLVFPQLLWLLLGINNNFVGIQTLVAGGYDKEYRNAFQTGVVFTVIFNYIFIRFFKLVGAAFAPMISELFLMILLEIKVKKVKSK